MNIQQFYKKVLKEEASKSDFMYFLRRDDNAKIHINNTTSFEDAVKILKAKQLLFEEAKPEATTNKFDFVGTMKSYKNFDKEQKKKTVEQVNYYEFERGWRAEYLICKDVEKAKQKALKNLQKDDIYYTRLLTGTKKPEKRDDLPMEVSPDKKESWKDPNNQQKPVKKGNELVDKTLGAPKIKANVSKSNKGSKATKTPKGVKIMKEVYGSEIPNKVFVAFNKFKNSDGGKLVLRISREKFSEFFQTLKSGESGFSKSDITIITPKQLQEPVEGEKYSLFPKDGATIRWTNKRDEVDSKTGKKAYSEEKIESEKEAIDIITDPNNVIEKYAQSEVKDTKDKQDKKVKTGGMLDDPEADISAFRGYKYGRTGGQETKKSGDKYTKADIEKMKDEDQYLCKIALRKHDDESNENTEGFKFDIILGIKDIKKIENNIKTNKGPVKSLDYSPKEDSILKNPGLKSKDINFIKKVDIDIKYYDSLKTDQKQVRYKNELTPLLKNQVIKSISLNKNDITSTKTAAGVFQGRRPKPTDKDDVSVKGGKESELKGKEVVGITKKEMEDFYDSKIIGEKLGVFSITYKDGDKNMTVAIKAINNIKNNYERKVSYYGVTLDKSSAKAIIIVDGADNPVWYYFGDTQRKKILKVDPVDVKNFIESRHANLFGAGMSTVSAIKAGQKKTASTVSDKESWYDQAEKLAKNLKEQATPDTSAIADKVGSKVNFIVRGNEPDEKINVFGILKSGEKDKKGQLHINFKNGTKLVINPKKTGGYYVDKDGQERELLNLSDKTLTAAINQELPKDKTPEKLKEALKKVIKKKITEDLDVDPTAGEDVLKKKLEDLMKRYDWYYEDSKSEYVNNLGQIKHDVAMNLVDRLGKEGVKIFNYYAPPDKEISLDKRPKMPTPDNRSPVMPDTVQTEGRYVSDDKFEWLASNMGKWIALDVANNPTRIQGLPFYDVFERWLAEYRNVRVRTDADMMAAAEQHLEDFMHTMEKKEAQEFLKNAILTYKTVKENIAKYGKPERDPNDAPKRGRKPGTKNKPKVDLKDPSIKILSRKKIEVPDQPLDKPSYQFYVVNSNKKIVTGWTDRRKALDFKKQYSGKGFKIMSKEDVPLDPKENTNWIYIPGVNDYEFKQATTKKGELTSAPTKWSSSYTRDKSPEWDRTLTEEDEPVESERLKFIKSLPDMDPKLLAKDVLAGKYDSHVNSKTATAMAMGRVLGQAVADGNTDKDVIKAFHKISDTLK